MVQTKQKKTFLVNIHYQSLRMRNNYLVCFKTFRTNFNEKNNPQQCEVAFNSLC